MAYSFKVADDRRAYMNEPLDKDVVIFRTYQEFGASKVLGTSENLDGSISVTADIKGTQMTFTYYQDGNIGFE